MSEPHVVLPYSDSTATKKEQVAGMFNNISHRYDLLNRLLSFGIDIWWRKKTIDTLAPHKPAVILDVATGTADLAIEAMRLKPVQITGIDISEGMLEKGREKIRQLGFESIITLSSGDSEKLLFPENHFDAVMVSFGVRNFENLGMGLQEIYRVLKPGGSIVILEFSKPQNPIIKWCYKLYNQTLLPLTGRLLSRDQSAYTYLPESVNAFPEGAEFLKILTNNGFEKTTALPLTFGISTIYTGIK
jgi:demethylmenaquinone methyltransferase/2-methoxy-6-polyprenyl-1,4-benzoquinol methylase